MKILNKKRKRLEFILIVMVFSLFFSPQAEAEEPSAPAATEEIQEMDTLEGETMTMSGAGAELPPVSPSAIGGAFSSLMSGSFKTDLATGAATLNIPIVVPPGRKNVQPNIALSYSSGNANGICGVGWAFSVPAIQRSAKKGVPRYDDTDNFVVGGGELVKISEVGDEYEYRAKIESSFTKYLYSGADNEWIAYDKNGTQYHFGSTEASQMVHPTNPNYIFAWYIDRVTDVYGNTMTYTYEKEDNSVYLKYVFYTSNSLCDPALNADKRIEFVYESAARPDKIYNRRAGWPSVIKRRLGKIKVSIDSDKDLLWETGEAVWIYNLSYVLSADTSRSLLNSIQLEDSKGNTLPAKIFTYQALEP
ncbi:MAG: SpvB/TcaC N-terminal domain-containing protein [Candidatus Omnitrophota bacterium]|nr:SpvB/TcaC N-terminal domain-containing protein [Candidatus Omnitrophota bacterium]